MYIQYRRQPPPLRASGPANELVCEMQRDTHCDLALASILLFTFILFLFFSASSVFFFVR
jgi:hypothetical protein